MVQLHHFGRDSEDPGYLIGVRSIITRTASLSLHRLYKRTQIIRLRLGVIIQKNHIIGVRCGDPDIDRAGKPGVFAEQDRADREVIPVSRQLLQILHRSVCRAVIYDQHNKISVCLPLQRVHTLIHKSQAVVIRDDDRDLGLFLHAPLPLWLNVRSCRGIFFFIRQGILHPGDRCFLRFQRSACSFRICRQ